MLFNSTTYLIFLPLIVLMYHALLPSQRRILLLLASYFFYASWNWKYLGLLITSTVINYEFGLRIAGASNPIHRRAWLAFAIILNLAVLCVFKYANWFADVTHGLLGFSLWTQHRWLLPLGISFYTFEVISYLVDEFRGVTRPIRSLLDMALYVSFFPHLIAGPIIRANDLVPQLACDQPIDWLTIREGLARLIWGMTKKVFVVDVMAHVVNEVYAAPASYSGAGLMLATYAFAVQIYCDFSAYSDMAIGSALLLGIRLPENFERPYLSCGVREFWRRWHISLSAWLRDYVYIPLGGNRIGIARTYVNLLLTMIIAGIWHGAGAAWLLWGFFHGAVMCLERFIGMSDKPPSSLGWRLVRGFITFHLVCFSWILFRAGTLSAAGVIVHRIFTVATGELHVSFAPLVYLLALIVAESQDLRHRFVEMFKRMPTLARWTTYASAALFFLAFGRSAVSEFIYFQF